MVFENPVARIDFSTWIRQSFTVSPDARRVAYVARAGLDKSVLIVDGKQEGPYDRIGGLPVFSPDSKRVAYVAGEGDKRFVVVDGHAGKHYDGIGDGAPPGRPVFSPDSKRLAYAVKERNKWLGSSGWTRRRTLRWHPGRFACLLPGQSAAGLCRPTRRQVVRCPGWGRGTLFRWRGKRFAPIQPGGQTRCLRGSSGRQTARRGRWCGRTTLRTY